MKNFYGSALIVLLVLIGSGNAIAQIVNIPDANFKAALLAHVPVVNTNGDGEIQVSEAAAFSGTLSVSNKNIADLSGIEVFTSLSGLNCGYNQLTSLNVTANTILTNLTCNHNQLTTLDVVINTALTTLKCYNNQLTSLDVTTNIALTNLWCYDNQLTSLDVTSNIALTTFWCYNNQLTSLNVTANTALIQLICNGNPLTSLNVTANTALIQLNCNDNQLTSLNVTANTALEYLYCNNNTLTSLDLTTNVALYALQCTDNQLTSLDLTGKIALTDMRCDNNQLTSLDLTTNLALVNLYCSNNQLTSLDLTSNVVLVNLHCDNNQLISLDGANNNTHLSTLYCDHNQLTSLDLTGNTALIIVNCSYNQLISLNLTGNAVLRTLWCHNNQLTLLDLTTNTALNHFYGSDNQFSSLVFTANTALTQLYCYNNQLTSLNLTTNIILLSLQCEDNQLTSLDLTNNTALAAVNCSGNQLISLDLRNGNNMVITNANFKSIGNSNLKCISVDGPMWSMSNWTNIDPQTEFSSNCSCGVVSINIDSVSNISCSDLGFARVSATGANGPFQYEWQNAPLSTDSILIADTAGIYTLKVTDINLCESFPKIVIKSPKVTTGFELNTNLHTGLFRPGRVTKVDLSAWNDGCVVENGQLTLTYNGPLTFLSSALPPTSQTGDTLKWDLGNMEYALSDFLSTLQFRVDTLAQSGDRVCFEVSITPSTGDAMVTNNFKSYCFDVRNSYDPNDKQVYPQGVCAENYTLKNHSLTYTIRFQNTGNAPAIDVFLLDTISPYLNLHSIRVLETSHAGLVTEILGSKILKFDFKNINLADSLSDEEGSKGFVTYEIEPNPGLSEGTVIENTAGIYFDFNPPVITNTTKNTLVSVLPQIAASTITETACGTYTAPNHAVYTSSGTYTAVVRNTSGCDSIITINLTVKNPSSSTISETVCNSYTAPNGIIYSTSGTFTAVIPNASGCDSTITINLTVNNSSTSNITESVCGSYTAPDGQIYTTSGTYTAIIPNGAGCDSIITVNLTVNPAFDASLIEVWTGGEVQAYPVDGDNYEWYRCMGALENLSFSGSVYPDAMFNDMLQVIVSRGACTDTSDCTLLYLEDLDEYLREKIKLYPNPTDGLFHIDLGQIYSNVTIKITDLQGREIKREEAVNQQHFEVELNEAAGIYLVHVLSHNQELSVIRVVRE